MADKKISDLTSASSIADADLFEIETAGGNSRKVTGATLKALSGLSLVEKWVADGTTSSKTFSSIPGTGNDLLFTAIGRGTNSADQEVAITVNSLGASGYDHARHYSSGTGTHFVDDFLAGSSWHNIMNLPGSSNTAGFAGGLDMTIIGYAQTSFHKQMVATARWCNSTTSGKQWEIRAVGQARTTSAISSVTFAIAAGNFASGTIIACYKLG